MASDQLHSKSVWTPHNSSDAEQPCNKQLHWELCFRGHGVAKTSPLGPKHIDRWIALHEGRHKDLGTPLMRLAFKNGSVDWPVCGWYSLRPAVPTECLNLRDHLYTEIVCNGHNVVNITVSLADFDVRVTETWQLEDNFNVFDARVSDGVSAHKCLQFFETHVDVQLLVDDAWLSDDCADFAIQEAREAQVDAEIDLAIHEAREAHDDNHTPIRRSRRLQLFKSTTASVLDTPIDAPVKSLVPVATSEDAPVKSSENIPEDEGGEEARRKTEEGGEEAMPSEDDQTEEDSSHEMSPKAVALTKVLEDLAK